MYSRINIEVALEIQDQSMNTMGEIEWKHATKSIFSSIQLQYSIPRVSVIRSQRILFDEAVQMKYAN